jgi:serine/threonine protein phosphatase PrpC
MSKFRVATGSVVGRDHVRVRKNNQDAVAAVSDAFGTVLVVCDGCSSEPHSEVGAKLLTDFIRSQIEIDLTVDWHDENDRPVKSLVESPKDFVDRTQQAVDKFLNAIADAHFAPYLAAVITEEVTVIFGMGDGMYAVNGTGASIQSPNNAPHYPVYRVLNSRDLDETQARPDLEPKIHYVGPSAEITSVLIGTDGAEQIESVDFQYFLDNPRCQLNPSLIQKRLNVLAETPNLLRDDTTVAIAWRT